MDYEADGRFVIIELSPTSGVEERFSHYCILPVALQISLDKSTIHWLAALISSRDLSSQWEKLNFKAEANFISLIYKLEFFFYFLFSFIQSSSFITRFLSTYLSISHTYTHTIS